MAITQEERERKALSETLRSTAQGGSALAGGSFGAGANVPEVIGRDPVARQLLEEQVSTRAPAPVPTPTPTPTPGVDGTPGRGDVPTPDLTGAGVDGGVPSTDRSGALIEAINAQFGDQGGRLSLQDIQGQEQDAIQRQLSALNARFNQRVRTENVAGEGRLGQTRALSSVSGTLFDPLGGASRAKTERANQAVVDEINREREVAVSNLYAQARGDAAQRFESQEDRFVATADSFIGSLTSAYNLSLNEANSIQNNAARIRGLDLDEQQQDLMLRKYLTDVAFEADENSRQNERLDLAVQQAARDGFQVTQLPDGTIGYYDFSQGAPTFTAIGNYAKTTGNGSGDRDGLGGAAINEFLLSGGSLRGMTGVGLGAIEDVFEERGGNISSFDPGTLLSDFAGRAAPSSAGGGAFQFEE